MADISSMIKNRTRNNETLKPVTINNINDIRKAIIPFIKEIKNNKVKFSSDISWVNDEGNSVITNINAYSTDPDLRLALLNGLKQIEEQDKLWNDIRNTLEDDEYGTSLPEVDIDNITMPVDKLIKQRLGGKRHGMTIKWHVENKIVIFDPLNKTLEII